MLVQAEVSLYALGEHDLAASIYTFVRRLERPGLEIDIGRMSTLLTGESAIVFEALREAFEETALTGSRVLVVKLMHVDPRHVHADWSSLKEQIQPPRPSANASPVIPG